MKRQSINRRHFIKAVSAATACALVSVRAQNAGPILGQGAFRYRIVPDWGKLNDETPVENCHGIVCDRQGHVILLTDHPANNVIVYDKKGRLVHKWKSNFLRAHGLSIVDQKDRQVLFITDLDGHKVSKTSLDGKILDEWRWPKETGKYAEESEYKPSWTLHLPNGGFFVLDGYGKDYIAHHDAEGKFLKMFGGAEGGIVHWGPHGGMADVRDSANPSLLIAMSDQGHLLCLGLDGKKLGQIDLPGGNPRQVRLHRNHFFVAHLADNWPADRNSRGFLSVLDSNLRVISNVAGTPPEYDGEGRLGTMRHQEDIFIHPHDLIVDDEDSIYVAQYMSNRTYPLKLERI